jgi:hypothetical protein
VDKVTINPIIRLKTPSIVTHPLIRDNRIRDVRQSAIRTAEPLVSGCSRSEVEITTEKLRTYKSPGIDKIPAEVIQAGNEI